MRRNGRSVWSRIEVTQRLHGTRGYMHACMGTRLPEKPPCALKLYVPSSLSHSKHHVMRTGTVFGLAYEQAVFWGWGGGGGGGGFRSRAAFAVPPLARETPKESLLADYFGQRTINDWETLAR